MVYSAVEETAKEQERHREQEASSFEHKTRREGFPQHEMLTV